MGFGWGLGPRNRWLYRGGRPHRVARAINAVHARWFAHGFLAPRGAATLQVRGRRTGRLISCPVAVLHHQDGARYLVAMLGPQTNWARNARAAGGAATLLRGWHERVRLVEVPVPDRAPILRAYLETTPGARPHIRLSPDAPLAMFDAVAEDLPVFRVDPR